MRSLRRLKSRRRTQFSSLPPRNSTKFQLKKPSRAGLATLVSDVAKLEGFTLEAAAADLISLLGDGSYRDALSVLEKVIASADGKKITLASAEAATGAPKHALVTSLVNALAEGKQDDALAAINAAVKEEVSMTLYLTLILERIRLVLLVRHAPELRKEIQEEVGADEYVELEQAAKATESTLTHETLRVFLDASARIRFSPVPQLPLELAVLELFADR
jgi:DNA polymerase-3 subunit gamma/tau